MTSTVRIATALGALLLLAAPLAAQTAQEEEKKPEQGRTVTMQYFRPLDQRGINVFETTKEAGAEYTGFKVDFNAAFTSQVQNLSHRNTAAPNVVNGVNANQLANIGFGF